MMIVFKMSNDDGQRKMNKNKIEVEGGRMLSLCNQKNPSKYNKKKLKTQNTNMDPMYSFFKGPRC
jgi:hypothetical protein